MSESPIDFEAFLRHLREATGIRTQIELAEELGIRQSSISDAKRRGQIPAAWLLTLLYKRGLNPVWLTTGQGARYLAPADAQGGIAAPPPQNPVTMSTEQLVALVMERYRAAGLDAEFRSAPGRAAAPASPEPEVRQ
jgi:hypothetical protein